MITGSQALKLFVSNIALGILAVLLTACDGFPVEDFSTVPKKNEPQVYLAQHRHVVNFDKQSDRLATTEREKIDTFLSKIDIVPGDIVHVINGIPKPKSDGTVSHNVRDRRIKFVQAYLDYKRIPVTKLHSNFGVTPVTSLQVQVVVRRYIVTLPGCPNWTKPPGHDYYNHVSSNFGCATATNLGLMVANPGDLITGQKLEPADPYYTTVLMKRFREGEKVPLPINGESIGREIKQSGGGSNSGGGSGSGGGEGGAGGLLGGGK